jgi:DNA-binding response OmpR family regulator
MGGTILLLVEDDLNLQGLLEIALSNGGFNVVLASTGTQAMAQLDAAVPRAVVETPV